MKEIPFSSFEKVLRDFGAECIVWESFLDEWRRLKQVEQPIFDLIVDDPRNKKRMAMIKRSDQSYYVFFGTAFWKISDDCMVYLRLMLD